MLCNILGGGVMVFEAESPTSTALEWNVRYGILYSTFSDHHADTNILTDSVQKKAALCCEPFCLVLRSHGIYHVVKLQMGG